MPTLRSLPGGYTVACAPPDSARPPPGRGVVSSWSRGAAARNTAFLRAQPREGFHDGEAFAATLTLGRLPEDHREWQALRRAFVERLRRVGLVRLHWVVEWTRLGRPHLHASIWLPVGTPDGPELIRRHWLEVTARHRTLARSQHVEPIARFGGWARYVGKHAARGVGHYQRSRRDLPPGWSSTGRMWGHRGDWQSVEPVPTDLTLGEFHRLRRLVRAFEVARARAAGRPEGVRAARRMLRCTDRELSTVRGLSGWTDRDGEELDLLRSVVADVPARQARTADRLARRAEVRARRAAGEPPAPLLDGDAWSVSPAGSSPSTALSGRPASATGPGDARDLRSAPGGPLGEDRPGTGRTARHAPPIRAPLDRPARE